MTIELDKLPSGDNESAAPAYTFHLAELIEEEMRERNWDITDLVMNMGLHEDEKTWAVCQLSFEMFLALRDNPNVVLGEHMAQQLGDAFDVTPSFFTNYHDMWRKNALAKTAPAHPVADDPTLDYYRAGLLCGLETAAQWLEKYGNSVACSYAAGIRAIKDEEILAGGTK